jgi:hypothetical protein
MSFISKLACACAFAAAALVGHASTGQAQGTTGTIALQGVISGACNITVTSRPAATALPLSGTQRIYVGDIAQTCNAAHGYTLDVTSANCGGSPTGAKLQSAAFDPANAQTFAPYSVEFINPTTGGSSADVTGLLQSACASQTGRASNAPLSGESSQVWVNYNLGALAAGTFTDTLTITMTPNP